MGLKKRYLFFAVLAMYLISSAAGAVSTTECGNDCNNIENAECDSEATPPTCKCSDGYIEDTTDNNKCVKRKVSETDCTNGANGACTSIDNAECDSGTTKCKCSDGYKEDSADGSSCVKVLGGTCSDNNGCSNVGNAVCTVNKCTCDTDYGEKDNVCIRTVSGTTCPDNGNECDSIGNSHCDNGKCKCDAGYVMNVDVCTAESAGAVSDKECTTGDECNGIDHAVCDKEATPPKCKCSDGYIEDSTDNNKCVKILGGICSDNDGCSNVANAVCTGGKCACDTNFGEKDNVCIQTVSGTTCSENGNECDDIDNSHCDTDKCKCDAGYVMNVRACTAENAAASIQLGTLTVLLCALATLIQQF